LQAAQTQEEQERLAEHWEVMFEYQLDQPRVHELMQELRALVDEYPDRVLVGESEEIAYYGDGTNELHLAFNFPLMQTERLTPAWVRANQRERLAVLPPGAWPCNTLGNHDAPRVYSRYGDGKNDDALARLSLALMLTLWGTPFLYNGEEIGMTDLLLDDISQFRDTFVIRLYHLAVDDMGMPAEQVLPLVAPFGRDKCRTPMQWADAPNGGFSPAGVQTWLPVNLNYAQGVNVAEQLEDPSSLLNFYRRMLRVRKETPALIAGDYVPLREEAEDCLAFLRSSAAEGQTCLVVLNTSDQAHALDLTGSAELAPGLDAGMACLIFSSQARENEADDLSRLSVAPFEIYIAELI
jgi:alpha-glucosidase